MDGKGLRVILLCLLVLFSFPLPFPYFPFCSCHVYHYFFRGFFSSLTSMTTEPAFSNILPEQIFETALRWWSCRMQHVIDRKFPKGATLNRLDSNTVNFTLCYRHDIVTFSRYQFSVASTGC
ncbi:hypothetical protein GGS21DRAFT_6570 [Xylaria nigripes]|nr:hypothetical protein GGS21DRAFT_6570 [Xylaria nigripes]